MKKQSSWPNYFINLFSQFFNNLLIFTEVRVIRWDIFVAVKCAKPSPSDGSRRIIVASVQHPSQA